MIEALKEPGTLLGFLGVLCSLILSTKGCLREKEIKKKQRSFLKENRERLWKRNWRMP